jgi:hypothetical protein
VVNSDSDGLRKLGIQASFLQLKKAEASGKTLNVVVSEGLATSDRSQQGNWAR